MFAHLLIITELFILAAAYYFVFVREPKPFEIKENIWGYYDQPAEGSTGYGITAQSAPKVVGKRSRRVRRVIHTGHVLLRSAKHGVKRKIASASALQQGWVDSKETKPQSSTISSLLAYLGEALVKLSVKLS